MERSLKKLLALVAVVMLLAPFMALSPAKADGSITATDPEGDVELVAVSGRIPREYYPKIDITGASLTVAGTTIKLAITFASPPFTVDDVPKGYALSVSATIRGTVNGKEGSLSIAYGNITYNTYGDPVIAVLSSDDGSLGIFVIPSMGGNISASVSGNRLVIIANVPEVTFTPTIGNSTNPSQIDSGLGQGGIPSTTYIVDSLNFYEQGSSGGGGGEITSPTTTTAVTTTTTTTEYGETTNPLEEQPTTDAVSVHLNPPDTSRITVDTAHNMIEIEVSGTGSTTGQAPNHVGVGLLYYTKDGNFSYDMFNGDGEWDGDGPENGYVLTQSLMGYSIDIRVQPTGPADNPWATFSYRLYAKVPMDYITAFQGISQLDRAYIYARAYLDRDEALWNQAYVQAPINAGTGNVVTTTTPGGSEGTTTTQTTEAGTGTSTTTTQGGAETPSTGGAAGGINPLVLGGVVAAVAVVGVAAFLLKKK